MVADKERRFHDAMLNIYRRALRDCGYKANQFLGMVAEYGGLATARRLLAARDVQYGFDRLWELGRLDLTVEAHVLSDEFIGLFSPAEIAEAYDRLIQHDETFFVRNANRYGELMQRLGWKKHLER